MKFYLFDSYICNYSLKAFEVCSFWYKISLYSPSFSHYITTEFKIHWSFRKFTHIVWHLMYFDCTSLYLLLTSSVPHCTLLFISNDQHCTPLYKALTITEPHCSPLYIALTSTVTQRTPCILNLKEKNFLNNFSMIFSSIFSYMQHWHRKEFNRPFKSNYVLFINIHIESYKHKILIVLKVI